MEVRQITDQDIVSQILAGDTDAFRYLVERYQQPVAKLIYFKLQNSNVVEDLTQETFVRAYKYLHSYDPSKSLKNWLLTIAMNRCTSWKRQQVFTVPLKNLFHLAIADNTSKQAMDQLFLREIKSLVHKLPSKERDVVILHYIHELNLREVAEVLNIPVGTVKSRLNRGLKRLREQTEDVYGRESYEAQSASRSS